MPAKKKKGFANRAQEVRWRKFVEHYVTTTNATESARAAGFKGSTKVLQVTGSQLLSHPMIQEMIEARRKEMAIATGITPEKILQRWWLIATADPRELAEFHRSNCRYCWGIDHAYQWTDAEWERACAQARLMAERKAKPKMRHGRRRYEDDDEDEDAEPEVKLPDDRGGFGFIGTREPNPGCPECFGRGVGETVLKDTRSLSPAALALYAGVKQTKEGLEVKMQDQGDALNSAARHLGMFGKEGGVTFNHNTVNMTEVHVTADQVRDELSEIFGNAAIPAPKKPAIEH